MVPASATITLAATTELKIRIEPTERSKWPAMIRNAMPIASIAITDVSNRMLRKFSSAKNPLPPQIQKPTMIPARARNSQLSEMSIRAGPGSGRGAVRADIIVSLP